MKLFYRWMCYALKYIWIGLAGSVGASMRYLIGLLLITNSLFPFSTLIINLIGCYLLALLTTTLFRMVTIPTNLKLAIGTGLIGSFTTFSTISVETVQLFEDGRYSIGTAYIFCTIFGGLLFSRLGYQTGKEK